MKRRLLIAFVASLGFVFVLFDVDVDPQFALARTVEVADEEQEGRYLACVAERDAVIHEETFSTIDNPDVQREVLATRKARAKLDCRAAHPERTVTVEEPFRFNLVDLEFRF